MGLRPFLGLQSQNCHARRLFSPRVGMCVLKVTAKVIRDHQGHEQTGDLEKKGIVISLILILREKCARW